MVAAATLVGTSEGVFGAIYVREDCVRVVQMIDVSSLTCDQPSFNEYKLAWTDANPCDRPDWIDERVFGLTYTHLKIITSDNQCLLLNGRIDPTIAVPDRTLIMNIPIGVPISSSSVTFEPLSDFTSFVLYSPSILDPPVILERGSSYRIEITEQVRTCVTRQTAERILVWAVVDIPPPCCEGMTGDVDGSGRVDILDINYLISWMFRGGPAPPCMDEADVDGSGQVDILDANYFVDWLFRGGPAPLPCP